MNNPKFIEVFNKKILSQNATYPLKSIPSFFELLPKHVSEKQFYANCFYVEFKKILSSQTKKKIDYLLAKVHKIHDEFQLLTQDFLIGNYDNGIAIQEFYKNYKKYMHDLISFFKNSIVKYQSFELGDRHNRKYFDVFVDEPSSSKHNLLRLLISKHIIITNVILRMTKKYHNKFGIDYGILNELRESIHYFIENQHIKDDLKNFLNISPTQQENSIPINHMILYRLLLDIELETVDNNLIENGFRTHEIAFVKTNHESKSQGKENRTELAALMQSMHDYFQLMNKETQNFAPLIKEKTSISQAVLEHNSTYNHDNANTDAHQRQLHLNRMKMAEENLTQLKAILSSMEEFSNHFKTKT